jgi:hypothetical protein
MTTQKRDLEIIFYEHHSGVQMEHRVMVCVGGGRAETVLTLQEFCELLADCRKEIARLHWHSGGAEAQIGGERQTES